MTTPPPPPAPPAASPRRFWRGFRPVWLGLGALAWLLAVGWGMYALAWHENTPGAAARRAPARWPAGSAVGVDPGAAYSLVMFAHPHCPCTRASLHELQRLVTDTRGQLRATVFFLLPTGTGDDWRHTANWELARAIPDTTVLADPAGRQAGLFDAATSGQALIYDRAGRLRFQGGLTGSRGHEGDNPARAAALALVGGNVSPGGPFPVFGCPLHHAGETPATPAPPPPAPPPASPLTARR